MKGLQGIIILLFGAVIIGCNASNKREAKDKSQGVVVDLDDYIGVENSPGEAVKAVETEKKGDLNTAGTGYYHPYSYHHQHHPYHHGYHHGYHHHGYHHHVPHHHHHHGHAHSYLIGEYGHGHGHHHHGHHHHHVGSAHVSFGTEIEHPYPHHHHHYGR